MRIPLFNKCGRDEKPSLASQPKAQNSEESNESKDTPNNEGQEELAALSDTQLLGPPPDYQHNPAPINFSLIPIPSEDALLVKVQPLRAPKPNIAHVPCDIVLVIDVSGSMSTAAPVPGDDSAEGSPLSVLDLVKHAALTIVETLNENDRLGIVVFSTASTVVQELTPMTTKNKDAARKNIKGMDTDGITNLWHGILDGIELFKKAGGSEGRVPAVMVLTDGMPNHMCPNQGYIPKLRTMLPLPASIHTFGFGYSLSSGLIKSIAEIGNGNYAFIPDAGMIGTVFVHAMANLQNTMATDAEIELNFDSNILPQEAMGETVVTAKPELMNHSETGGRRSILKVQLGSIQYGQTRDIIIKASNLPSAVSLREHIVAKAGSVPRLYGTLRYKDVCLAPQPGIADQAALVTSNNLAFVDAEEISEVEIAYHLSRARICRYISSVFPLDGMGVHKQDGPTPSMEQDLKELIENLPANDFKDNPQCASLIKDLSGEAPNGQVSLAICNEEYFRKWGKHYLLSYLNAHAKQICNSFKDPGPLQYGIDTPLFIKCRDELDAAFDKLPPPEPSLALRNIRVRKGGAAGHRSGFTSSFSMSKYNNSMGPCFAGSTPVQLASGRKVPIRKLRRGVKMQTPLGSRKVALVLKTPVRDQMLCRIGEKLLVTPWHPISTEEKFNGRKDSLGKVWKFPADVGRKTVQYTGAIYSVLLQRDSNPEAHAMLVGGEGVWGVTLGHGVTSSEGVDVRGHHFLGDYYAVGKSLANLGVGKNGVVVGGGIEKDDVTGLICGFKKREGKGAAKHSPFLH